MWGIPNGREVEGVVVEVDPPNHRGELAFQVRHNRHIETYLAPRGMGSADAEIAPGDQVRIWYVLQLGIRSAAGIELLPRGPQG